MKEYIDKLKEIETLVELSIGTTMTEEKAADIYAVTNDLMYKVNKKLNISDVSGRSEQLFCECQRNNPYTGVKFDFDLRCFTCNRVIEQNNCH